MGMTARQLYEDLAKMPPYATACVLVRPAAEKVFVARIRGLMRGGITTRIRGGYAFNPDGEAPDARNCVLLYAAGRERGLNVVSLRSELSGVPEDYPVVATVTADESQANEVLHVVKGYLANETETDLEFEDNGDGPECCLIY